MNTPTSAIPSAAPAPGSLLDPFDIIGSSLAVQQAWLNQPERLSALLQGLALDTHRVHDRFTRTSLGMASEPAVPAVIHDQRFQDPAWIDHPGFAYLKELYCLSLLVKTMDFSPKLLVLGLSLGRVSITIYGIYFANYATICRVQAKVLSVWVAMRSYRKGSHTVHDLKVHLVWITKYRYNVLTKEVGLRIRELIRQVCDANEIEIIQGRVSKDHIHLYVSYPPHLSVSDMVRLMKGRSSRRIQEEFPQLEKRYWGKHFWGIGYAAFSSGHVTDEMIQAYLKDHENHPNHRDDDFVIE